MSPDRVQKFFSYQHLPIALQEVSIGFNTLAYWMLDNLQDNEQRMHALQKLLEAKDCAVRAKLLEI